MVSKNINTGDFNSAMHTSEGAYTPPRNYNSTLLYEHEEYAYTATKSCNFRYF